MSARHPWHFTEDALWGDNSNGVLEELTVLRAWLVSSHHAYRPIHVLNPHF